MWHFIVNTGNTRDLLWEPLHFLAKGCIVLMKSDSLDDSAWNHVAAEKLAIFWCHFFGLRRNNSNHSSRKGLLISANFLGVKSHWNGTIPEWIHWDGNKNECFGTDILWLKIKGAHGITHKKKKKKFQNYLLLFFSNVSASLDKLYYQV